MKKLLGVFAATILVLSVLPSVLAAGIGSGLGGKIGVEDFPPIVWQCGERRLTEDMHQPWRITECIEAGGDIICPPLFERINNYLFEGEKYQVDVVVFDKNKIQDVVVDMVLEGGYDEYSINCVPTNQFNFDACNARIDEEEITQFDPATMQGYTCTVTALDSEHMYGQYDLSVQADDGMDIGVYDEISRIWINPIISLDVDGYLDFYDVRPGTASYSQVYVENNAEGGVLLDMFITGKNWPAVAPNARCYDPYTNDLENYLSLGALSYYTEKGAYSTRDDVEHDTGYGLVVRDKDNEGYVNINYQMETGFTTDMFNDAEVIQAVPIGGGIAGYAANVLSPGASMDLTFRLMLPEPCYGEFESASEGSIFIWAEAI